MDESSDEVVRDALKLLVERQAVTEDLQASLADMQAGRLTSLDDVLVEIRQRHGWTGASDDAAAGRTTL